MPIQSYTSTLVKKELVTHEIYFLTLDLGERELPFAAGQYIILHVPRQDGEYVRRLYSIANAPSSPRRVELVLKRIPGGAATTYVESLEAGAEVKFDAPAGLFTLKPTGRDIIMLATNTGITPFRSMIHDELSRGPLTRNIHMYWGMRHFSDVYYYDEFVELSKKDPKFHYTVCLSRDKDLHPSCINKRIDHTITEEILPTFDAAAHDFYICGGVKVIDILRDMLLKHGIEKQHIYFEKFI